MTTLTLAPFTSYDWGAFFALVIAGLAWRMRWLRPGGAAAAFAVGTAVFGAGRLPYALVLLAFFLSGTLLGRMPRAKRAQPLADTGKQGARDGAQVLANGGVAAACAVLAHGSGGPWQAAFAGAFAAAAADTWATEIGTRVGGTPRHVLTWRPLQTGISGGVTLLGSVAGVGGAGALALVAWALHVAPVLPVLAAGVAGAACDSLLGATLQAQRRCPQCRELCETEPHRCGAQTSVVRGLPWLENDGVNLAATICGALVASWLA